MIKLLAKGCRFFVIFVDLQLIPFTPASLEIYDAHRQTTYSRTKHEGNYNMLGTKLKATSQFFVRRNSTFSEFIKKAESGSLLALKDTEKALSNQPLEAEQLKSLHLLLKQNISPEVTNHILHFGLPQDFSLYHTVSKIPLHQWSEEALVSLIENNPGRVYTLENLVKRHLQGEASARIRELLVKKLLLGEVIDQGEEQYRPSESSIQRAIDLINEINDPKYYDDSLHHLFKAVLDCDSLDLLVKVESSIGQWISQHKLRNLPEEATDVHFLQLAHIIFQEDALLLTKEDICHVLSLEGLDEKFRPLMDEVLDYVETCHLDFDKNDANSLLLRLQLIETYGISRNAVDKMLEKFHAYQAKEKFGIEYVQSKVVKAFCYQSFSKNDATQLKIAETLVLPDGMPVSTVAELIVANGQFSAEKSLEVYNQYIQLVSATLNEVTHRSPKGVLTEALLLSCLYNNDRSFAELVYQKAIETKTISDEHEIAGIKKVFKAYGEAFVEDDWEKAKPLFKQHILKFIKNVGKFN